MSILGTFGRGKGQGARAISIPEACVVFVSWNPRQGYDPTKAVNSVPRVERFGRYQGEDARAVSVRVP